MSIHHVITATQATRTFSDLLNQVRYQGKSFDIKRGKEVIAVITPAVSTKGVKINMLNTLLEDLPTLDEKDLDDFEKTIKKIRKIMHVYMQNSMCIWQKKDV